MKYQVLDKLKAKTSHGNVELSPGQIISLEPQKAINLVEKGKIKPLTGEKPFLQSNGTLIVPNNCDPKYHWWAGGQSIADTLRGLGVPLEVWKRYTSDPHVN